MKASSTMVGLLLCAMFILSHGCNEDPGLYTLDTLSGLVQKGPFINGTAITIAELDENLDPTGKTFSTQITDNEGSFEVNNVALISPYVEIRADGYYFNEISGTKSTSQLTLFGLADISEQPTVNVNILTQLEKSRVEYLVGEGMGFAEAKAQAQGEVIQIFEFEFEDMTSSEKLDISKKEEENAVLLAISLFLQGHRSVADLTELLANISSDIRDDGIVSLLSVYNEIFIQLFTTDFGRIRNNLVERYEELGVDAEIPDFEKYLLILRPPKLKVYYEVSSVKCNGDNTGAINVAVISGTPPYSFKWSNGATTKDISDLYAGEYSLEVKDGASNTLIHHAMIVPEFDEIGIDFEVTNRQGESNADIDITVSGGIRPYTYLWSNGSIEEDLTDIEPGEYTVQVTDGYDCIATEYITVDNN